MTVAREVPSDVQSLSNPLAVGVSGTARAEGGVLDSPATTSDYSGQVVFLGRFRPGRAPETRRVVHVFVPAAHARHDTILTARCGERLPVVDTQLLPGMTGMPCERCLLHSLAEGR